MKICFAVPDLSLGGYATVVHDILINWHLDTDELFLVCFFDTIDSRYKDLENITNLKIIKLGKKRTVDFAFLKRLKKCIKSISPDVISSHLSCTFYLKIVGALNHSKIYHTIHAEPVNDLPRIYRLFLNRDIKKEKIKLIGCCQYISNKAKYLYKCSCITITNGIDLSNISHTEKKSDTVNFLFVGRFDPVKNVPLLVDSFGSCNSANSRLTICGYGFDEKTIKKAIEESKRKKDIFLLGKTNDIDSIYEKSDVLCLISEREGMPMVVLEGLKHGLCFIASNVGGVSTYVKNDINGIFIDISNKESIVKAFNYFSDNPEVLKKFKKESRYIASTVDAKIMASEYRRVLHG